MSTPSQSQHDSQAKLTGLPYPFAFEDIRAFVGSHPEHFPIVSEVQSYLDSLDHSFGTHKGVDSGHPSTSRLSHKQRASSSYPSYSYISAQSNGQGMSEGSRHSKSNQSRKKSSDIQSFFSQLSFSLSSLESSLSAVGEDFLSSLWHAFVERVTIIEHYREYLSSLSTSTELPQPLPHLQEFLSTHLPISDITTLIAEIRRLDTVTRLTGTHLDSLMSKNDPSHNTIYTTRLGLVSLILPLSLTMNYIGQVMTHLDQCLRTADVHDYFRLQIPPVTHPSGTSSSSLLSSSSTSFAQSDQLIIVWTIYHTLQNVQTILATLVLYLAKALHLYCLPSLVALLLSSSESGNNPSTNAGQDPAPVFHEEASVSNPHSPHSIAAAATTRTSQGIAGDILSYSHSLFQYIESLNATWIADCNRDWTNGDNTVVESVQDYIATASGSNQPSTQLIANLTAFGFGFSYFQTLFKHVKHPSGNLSFHSQGQGHGQGQGIPFSLTLCLQQTYLAQLLCLKSYNILSHQHSTFYQFHNYLHSRELVQRYSLDSSQSKPSKQSVATYLQRQWESLAFPAIMSALAMEDYTSILPDSSQPDHQAVLPLSATQQKLVLLPYEQCARGDWVVQILIKIYYLKYVVHFYQRRTLSSTAPSTHALDLSISSSQFDQYRVTSPFPSIIRYALSQLKELAPLLHFLGITYTSSLTMDTFRTFSHELGALKQRTFLSCSPMHHISNSVMNYSNFLQSPDASIEGLQSHLGGSTAPAVYHQYQPYLTFQIQRWAELVSFSPRTDWFPIDHPTTFDPFAQEDIIKTAHSHAQSPSQVEPLSLIYSPSAAFHVAVENVLYETILLMIRDVGQELIDSIHTHQGSHEERLQPRNDGVVNYPSEKTLGMDEGDDDSDMDFARLLLNPDSDNQSHPSDDGMDDLGNPSSESPSEGHEMSDNDQETTLSGQNRHKRPWRRTDYILHGYDQYDWFHHPYNDDYSRLLDIITATMCGSEPPTPDDAVILEDKTILEQAMVLDQLDTTFGHYVFYSAFDTSKSAQTGEQIGKNNGGDPVALGVRPHNYQPASILDDYSVLPLLRFETPASREIRVGYAHLYKLLSPSQRTGLLQPLREQLTSSGADIYSQTYTLYSVIMTELRSFYDTLHQSNIFGLSCRFSMDSIHKSAPDGVAPADAMQLLLPLVTGHLSARPKLTGNALTTLLSCFSSIGFQLTQHSLGNWVDQQSLAFFHIPPAAAAAAVGGDSSSTSPRNRLHNHPMRLLVSSILHNSSTLSTADVQLMQRAHGGVVLCPRSSTSSTNSDQGADQTTLYPPKGQAQSPLSLTLLNKLSYLHKQGVCLNPYHPSITSHLLHHSMQTTASPSHSKMPGTPLRASVIGTIASLQGNVFARGRNLSAAFISTTFTRHMFYQGIIMWALGNLAKISPDPMSHLSSKSSGKHDEVYDVHWTYVTPSRRYTDGSQSRCDDSSAHDAADPSSLEIPIPFTHCAVSSIGTDKHCQTYTSVNKRYDQLLQVVGTIILNTATTVSQRLDMTMQILLPIIYAMFRLNYECITSLREAMELISDETAEKLIETSFSIFYSTSESGKGDGLKTIGPQNWRSLLRLFHPTKLKQRNTFHVDQSHLFGVVKQLLHQVHCLLHQERSIMHIDHDNQFAIIHLYHQYAMQHQMYWNFWYSFQKLYNAQSATSTGSSSAGIYDRLHSIRGTNGPHSQHQHRPQQHEDEQDAIRIQMAVSYLLSKYNLPLDLPITADVIGTLLLDKPPSPYLVHNITTIQDYKTLLNMHLGWEHRVLIKEIYGTLTKIRRLYVGILPSTVDMQHIHQRTPVTAKDGIDINEFKPIADSDYLRAKGYPVDLPLLPLDLLNQALNAILTTSWEDDDLMHDFIKRQTPFIEPDEDEFGIMSMCGLHIDPLTITTSQPFGTLYGISQRYPIQHQHLVEKDVSGTLGDYTEHITSHNALFYALLSCFVNRDYHHRDTITSSEVPGILQNTVQKVEQLITDIIHLNNPNPSEIAPAPHSLTTARTARLFQPYYKVMFRTVTDIVSLFSSVSLKFFSSGAHLFQKLLAGWNEMFKNKDENAGLSGPRSQQQQQQQSDDSSTDMYSLAGAISSSSTVLDWAFKYFIDSIQHYDLPSSYFHQFLLDVLDRLDNYMYTSWLTSFPLQFHRSTLQVVYYQICRLLTLLSRTLCGRTFAIDTLASLTPTSLPTLHDHVQQWAGQLTPDYMSILTKREPLPFQAEYLTTTHYLDTVYDYATYDKHIKYGIFRTVIQSCRLDLPSVPALRVDELQSSRQDGTSPGLDSSTTRIPFLFSQFHEKYPYSPDVNVNDPLGPDTTQSAQRHGTATQEQCVTTISHQLLELLPRTRSFLVLTLLPSKTQSNLLGIFEQLRALIEVDPTVSSVLWEHPATPTTRHTTRHAHEHEEHDAFRQIANERNNIYSQSFSPEKLAFLLACYGVSLPLVECEQILALHSNQHGDDGIYNNSGHGTSRIPIDSMFSSPALQKQDENKDFREPSLLPSSQLNAQPSLSEPRFVSPQSSLTGQPLRPRSSLAGPPMQLQSSIVDQPSPLPMVSSSLPIDKHQQQHRFHPTPSFNPKETNDTTPQPPSAPHQPPQMQNVGEKDVESKLPPEKPAVDPKTIIPPLTTTGLKLPPIPTFNPKPFPTRPTPAFVPPKVEAPQPSSLRPVASSTSTHQAAPTSPIPPRNPVPQPPKAVNPPSSPSQKDDNDNDMDDFFDFR